MKKRVLVLGAGFAGLEFNTMLAEAFGDGWTGRKPAVANMVVRAPRFRADSTPVLNTNIAVISQNRCQPWRLVMKTLLLLPILLGLITLPTARADQKEEDAAIHHRHDEWAAAWNKHDPKLMSAFFVADGDLINPFGRHAQSTAEIEKLFTDEHTGAMAGTTYAGTIENIRYIGKNVAIVDVTGEISGMKGPDGAAAPPFKHHVTWITEKKAGKWMADSARAFVLVPAPTPPK